MSKLILAVVLSLVVSPLAAQEDALDSGAGLLSVCKAAIAAWEGATVSPVGLMRAMQCRAYIRGFDAGRQVTETLLLASFQLRGETDWTEQAMKQALKGIKTSRLICIPDGAAVAQIIRTVVRYLEQHPEQLHVDPPFLVFPAMMEAFPCK